MERLPHHDAVDHLASMTRIAWLNGAFGAADEIERLRAGGCARGQRTTQFCAEAAALQSEIERLRKELRAWQDAHRAHPDEFGGNPE